MRQYRKVPAEAPAALEPRPYQATMPGGESGVSFQQSLVDERAGTVVRYCPAGDGAFADWVKRCPECGRSLREAPPEEEVAVDENAGEIVWLATAPNEPIGAMWAEDLRGVGIPVLLRPGGPGFGAWGSVAVFEHHLYVRAPDIARARALLEELAADGDDGPAPDDDADEAPPSPS